jgi:DDE superfamily endonuclease
LTTCGLEAQDWSAAYRLFSEQRLPIASIFSVLRRHVLAELPPQAPLSVAIDDTLLPKSGLRIPGVAWRRDPLGPKFQTNFVRAQRFLQFSAAVPLSGAGYRMVPLAFFHAPTPAKPSPKASDQQHAEYRRAARQARLPLKAVQHLASLRQDLDSDPDGVLRQLQCVVDGGYTNETVLKKLPDRTTLIGRIRKDAKLYFPPQPSSQKSASRGRPRHYGAPAPTPEQLRSNDSVPWTFLDVSVSGAPHQMRIKCLGPILWRAAGLKHTLQLVVIAPLSYRLRKNSRLLYHQPAFLICTDPNLDVRALVQSFVQRWGIEVNFREEKTLLGIGQSQVRDAVSVESVPALQVASYAMFQLASLHTLDGDSKLDLLPAPKWAAQAPPRFSTQRAINHLRAEVWGRALGLLNFSDFAPTHSPDSKPEKFVPDLRSAVLYAVN